MGEEDGESCGAVEVASAEAGVVEFTAEVGLAVFVAGRIAFHVGESGHGGSVTEISRQLVPSADGPLRAERPAGSGLHRS